MNEFGKTVYLYGLDDEYRVLHYERVPVEYPSIREMKLYAWTMHAEYPSASMIFAANNCYALYRACVDSMKKKTLDDRVIFKIMLESEGIQLF